MAQAISSYLKLNMENKILVHWACYKVEQKHLNTNEVATVCFPLEYISIKKMGDDSHDLRRVLYLSNRLYGRDVERVFTYSTWICIYNFSG